MAHARTRSPQSHLHKGISRADPKGRRTFRSRRDLEGPFFFSFYFALDRCMRCVLRSFRSVGAAGSHDHSNSAASGFLLLVAVCSALVPAALDGNTSSPYWARDYYRWASALAILVW